MLNGMVCEQCRRVGCMKGYPRALSIRETLRPRSERTRYISSACAETRAVSSCMAAPVTLVEYVYIGVAILPVIPETRRGEKVSAYHSR